MGSRAALLNMQAREAFRSGRTRPIEWRMRQLDAIVTLLREREDDINQAVYQDLGKSHFETFATEVSGVFNSCDLMRNNLKKWMRPQKVSTPLVVRPASGSIVAEPLGVVLIFSTWNYPILLALDPLIGAIGAGNAAVLKLSEVAPTVSSLFAKVIPSYLDGDAIKVVEGGIAESEDLLAQRWDKIFYTGSPQVGKIIMAAAAKHLTPVTLELGGKSPTIIDSSTDFEVAARRIASGKWGINLGQTCLAPDYILVEKNSAQKLLDTLVTTLKEFFGTNPENSDLTRVVNTRHFSRLKAYLEDPNTAKTVAHGGQWNEASLFIEPTILLDPPLDAAVMTEEIFGPILPIVTLRTISDAIEFVNSREKPLALYLFSDNEDLKNRFINETSAGGVLVNDAVIHFGVSALPFGGVGKSGMGVYHGKHSFDTFSHMKPVLVRGIRGDAAIRYPPYTPAKQSILRRICRFQYLDLLLHLLGLRK
ncbi:hypothetical protein GOP47_0029748 [Adiantum capillus-veneris]|nr:hypothetical protein GOP47_0029748 [Adiantum capillus-veneris]